MDKMLQAQKKEKRSQEYKKSCFDKNKEIHCKIVAAVKENIHPYCKFAPKGIRIYDKNLDAMSTILVPMMPDNSWTESYGRDWEAELAGVVNYAFSRLNNQFQRKMREKLIGEH